MNFSRCPVIIAEVERLHWRIWNGKAQNARRTIERIRTIMPIFKGECGHRTTGVPSHKLWRALHEVDTYLSSQSTWLVITPDDIAPACVSEPRLPKVRRTSLSIGVIAHPLIEVKSSVKSGTWRKVGSKPVQWVFGIRSVTVQKKRSKLLREWPHDWHRADNYFHRCSASTLA